MSDRDAGKVGLDSSPVARAARAREFNERVDRQRRQELSTEAAVRRLVAFVLWLVASVAGVFAVIFFVLAMTASCIGDLCMSGQSAVPNPSADLLATIVLGGVAVGLGFAARAVRR